jgi:hypothetical protein
MDHHVHFEKPITRGAAGTGAYDELCFSKYTRVLQNRGCDAVA